MNILILTPDAVGSTLLQRLITVYCQFQNFSPTYINLHELTNGISKFYSHDFNCEILRNDGEVGYSQSLPQIIDLLAGADHQMVARLAKYHLMRRQDPNPDVSRLYQFCNDNFFVIATRRSNVFEYALSHYINQITGRLNVYTPNEKISTFSDLCQSPILLDQRALIRILDQYREYVTWSEEFFNIGAYFDYSKDVNRIEQYILDLPLFASQPRHNWQEVFGLNFNDWNLCHFLTSGADDPANLLLPQDLDLASKDFPLLEHYYKQDLIKEYHDVSDQSWPEVNDIQDYANLPEHIMRECRDFHNVQVFSNYQRNLALLNSLPRSDQDFLKKHQVSYCEAAGAVKQMVTLGILPGSIPIKKQTLAAKSKIIKNFSESLHTYNQWAEQHHEISQPIPENEVRSIMATEQDRWKSSDANQVLTHEINDTVCAKT